MGPITSEVINSTVRIAIVMRTRKEEPMQRNCHSMGKHVLARRKGEGHREMDSVEREICEKNTTERT